MAGVDLANLYDAPQPPPSTGDALTDLEIAWGWLQDFFYRRTVVIDVLAGIVVDRIDNAL